ncbi:transcription initiation factor TFIID subunit 8 [Cannabis sativa]|uniref:transcription initiation factor TFIID subunit 8 n=1 Tax=Cannabis sativa TaxID=3483 RepID=UPI0029CA0EF6|nr:transcription initiation factor TFIID subunit 8 [Cannabis sativa]
MNDMKDLNMNHGDVDGTRVNEQGGAAPRRPGADDFGRAVSKIVVAQICENVGFQSSKESALDALADIAIRYLCDLGKMAYFYANLTGRTECNVFDIIRALEVLEASQGFVGASDVSHCLASSGVVKDIADYVSSAEEIPFARPVPRFPVLKNRRLIPSFAQMGENPPGHHIPSWLPAFPDPHTYIHTPMWDEKNADPRAHKIEHARQRRKAERSLLSLQQRLVCNGSLGTSASLSLPSAENGLQQVERNPFLEPPMNSGEIDVSPVVCPEKLSDKKGNHPSVLEAFAPAIEAVKSGFSDDGEDERKILPDPNVRSAVHFKFRTAKKYFGESLDLNLQKKGVGRPAYWFGRDDERDDKKRRAEYILRQSMENPQELNQL